MKAFIVYCHPSEDSFTRCVRDAFIRGLEDAGHKYVLSDLYKMDFRTDMTEKEYLDYITEDAKGYQFSMTLESAIQEAEEAYGASEAHMRLKDMTRLKAEGRRKEYYETASRVIDELKRAYRGSEDAAVRS